MKPAHLIAELRLHCLAVPDPLIGWVALSCPGGSPAPPHNMLAMVSDGVCFLDASPRFASVVPVGGSIALPHRSSCQFVTTHDNNQLTRNFLIASITKNPEQTAEGDRNPETWYFER